MSICYLEADDEITGAISKLRAVKDGEAVIVVPPGSRIATSRINFKLLAREGNERRLNLVAVSDEPSVRALAISAGLPAYDSIAAAEKGLATFRDQDRRLADRLGRQPAEGPTEPAAPERESDVLERTQVLAIPHSTAETGSRKDAAALPAATGGRQAPARRRVGVAPAIAAAVLLLLAAGVGYGAYMFLPTATITLQPLATQLRLAPFTVTADPNVAVSDVAAGIVPAEWLEVPLSVTGDFAATGIEARETRATGIVRFRSENTISDVPVLEGTIVATGEGVDFETTGPALVPRADFATSTPGTVDVPVRASRPGPRGNVAAGAITVLSAGLRGQLVSVRNPDPTEGGRRVEEAVVSPGDYDAALAALIAQLGTELTSELVDPDTTPRGLTLFGGTARLGEPLPDAGPVEVVGAVAPTFTLTVGSAAVVLAVNEGLVDELAEARLLASLADGQQLIGNEVQTSRSAGTVVGETVTYEVAPVATVFSDPDRAVLVAGVRGKSIPEARQILAPYGMVEISIWPEFVDRLPDQPARISLVVVTPSPRP